MEFQLGVLEKGEMTMKVVIYSRCSTDEKRQDTEVQLKELRRYCKAYSWQYDEVSEYGSGFKDEQPKLKKVIEKIRLKHYACILVYSLDRFSRQHPKKTNALLDQLVYDHECRFIALKEGIDSQNEMIWNVIKPLFSYFSHVFSRQLSEKIRAGIKNKREKGQYRGGRPKKKYDLAKLKALAVNGSSLREIARRYNAGLTNSRRVSHTQVGRVLSSV
jgi:DNA invertase Pin-like site-specific DNA recombinase